MSSSEDDIPLAARIKAKPSLPRTKGSRFQPGITLILVDTDTRANQRIGTDKSSSKTVGNHVDREVDAPATSRPPTKSPVNKSGNSDHNRVAKNKRIAISDDESDDDVPLVFQIQRIKANNRLNDLT